MKMKTGHTFEQTFTVRPDDTATALGSGHLEVFATPALVALMENTAIRCIDGVLDPGSDTVGIEIHIKHVKATPVGKTVSCRATLVEIDGRRLRFNIEARDGEDIIGTAVHDRIIINPEKFMNKI